MIARNLVRIYAIRNTSISERRQKSVAIHIASMITPWRLNSLSAGNFLEWRDTGSPAGGCGVRHSCRLKTIRVCSRENKTRCLKPLL